MKNFATTLTINNFDVRMKDGLVNIKDIKKLAKHLNLPTKGNTPKAYFASEAGIKLLERAGETSLGKYASQFLIIKYAEHIDFRLLADVYASLARYNYSKELRVMVAAQTSMREAIWAAGGDWTEFVEECDLVNSIVLGCTASEFIEKNGLPEECYLVYLTDSQLAAIGKLQNLNTTLINEGVSSKKRGERLKTKFASISVRKEIDKLLESM